MLLIHPPASKPAEPPAGIAKLSGTLTGRGIKHTLLDANLEALLYIIKNTTYLPNTEYDKWTARALRNITQNLEAIKSSKTYKNIDRYKRAVIDLDHAIRQWPSNNAVIGIANYRHQDLSPLRSKDLFQSAENPETNPYYPYFSERLSGLLDEKNPGVIGFSLNYLSQALCTFSMIGFLKKHFPGLTIVLGGGLVTSWMKNSEWENPFRSLVDHLVSGQGEQELLKILGTADVEEGGQLPDYSQLPLDNYLAPGRILPYSASSGCFWNKCSFCPEKAEDNPYIPVPADMAINGLNELIIKTKPDLVHLLDNAISPSFLKKLSENPIGVPWYGFARISHLLTDIDYCMDLKKSGCVMLKLGLESGDQGVLNKMNKGIDIKTASLALKTLKKAGIATYVYLIFGTPEESKASARKTLEFVVNHKDEIGFFNVALFNMPVCGPEVSRFKTQSFYEGDLSLYTDFEHPGGWSRKEVRVFLDNEFRKERSIAEILKKDPPIFTSNHAPFF